MSPIGAGDLRFRLDAVASADAYGTPAQDGLGSPGASQPPASTDPGVDSLPSPGSSDQPWYVRTMRQDVNRSGCRASNPASHSL